MERTLSIKLPESVFQKVQHAATHTQRTIDDIIVNTINMVICGENANIQSVFILRPKSQLQ